MDFLKKLFPVSFNCKDEASKLVVGIIIYVVLGIIGSAVIWVAGLINFPVIGIILKILLTLTGTLLDLYITAGIVLAILVFCKVLK